MASDFEWHLVDHQIPATVKEYLELWYKRFNEAAGGNIHDVLPGMTALTVRQHDLKGGIRTYNFKFWFPEGTLGASYAVSIDLLEDQIFVPVDPYIVMARRILYEIVKRREEHGSTENGTEA